MCVILPLEFSQEKPSWVTGALSCKIVVITASITHLDPPFSDWARLAKDKSTYTLRGQLAGGHEQLAACEITLSKPHHCLILLFIASKGSHTLRDHPAHTSRRKHSFKCSWTPSNYNPNKIQHIQPCDFGTSKPLKINFLFRGALCCQSTANWTRHVHLIQRPPHHPRAMCPRAQEPWTREPLTTSCQNIWQSAWHVEQTPESFIGNKEVDISSLLLNPQNHPKSYVTTLWIWECWSSLSCICYDFLKNPLTCKLILKPYDFQVAGTGYLICPSWGEVGFQDDKN